MAHLGPETVSRRFAGMVKRCEDCGFDLAAGRVEVVPTAHYLMGGVVVVLSGVKRSFCCSIAALVLGVFNIFVVLSHFSLIFAQILGLVWHLFSYV